MDYVIGFTGTREGMPQDQGSCIAQMFHQCVATGLVQGKRVVLLHGMCVGADEQIHNLARKSYPDVHIEGYRVGRGTLVAKVEVDVEHSRTAAGHLARNREMVDRCDVLLGGPPCVQPQQRGGTWYTIKYAWRTRKVVLAFGPGGEFLAAQPIQEQTLS